MIKKVFLFSSFAIIAILTSVVIFSACQKENNIEKQEVNISDTRLETLASNLVATNLSDEEINKTISDFKNLSTDDYKRFINYQAGVMAKVNNTTFEIALQDRQLLLSKSMEKFGKSPNQLSEEEISLIVSSIEDNNLKATSGCPQYYHGVSTQQYSTYNTNCYDIWGATDPGETDCDYELVFYVGPMTLGSPYKIRGTTVAARNILNLGGVKGRQSGEYVYILVGKGRSDAIYLAVGIADEVAALKRDMKLQK
jgi:hypothetical protein